MATIRKLCIKNFRGIQNLTWCPSSGLNCLIGPGDSGKSTILDAIDWCLGARRTLPVTDADFHCLDVDQPLTIEVTLGALDDRLQNLDAYGLYIRGCDRESGEVHDEPGNGLEPVLSACLAVGSDLEPKWHLVSNRAEAQGVSRNLAWSDRIRLAPTRVGGYSTRHFSWQKGALVTRLTDENADLSAGLAEAARHARDAFGDSASDRLGDTLQAVQAAADRLGIDYGRHLAVLLDAQSVSFSGGTISLHDDRQVPLKRLGLGSSRLLAAGLQREIASGAPSILIDELEYGLEPHRISRFLQVLGSKEVRAPAQVFMTTHSPVVLRELAACHLWVVRQNETRHELRWAGGDDAVQGTLRGSPDAFLGKRVLMCEGATEVGLIRGLDLYRDDNRQTSFFAAGGAVVNAGGVTNIYRCAGAFQKLGYDIAVLRDDDTRPNQDDELAFKRAGGAVHKWPDGWATEHALFNALPAEAVTALYRWAGEIHGEDRVTDHVRSAYEGAVDINTWLEDLDNDKRKVLASAAGQGEWFKRIDWMEAAAHEIVGPMLAEAGDELSDVIQAIFQWVGAVDGRY